MLLRICQHVQRISNDILIVLLQPIGAVAFTGAQVRVKAQIRHRVPEIVSRISTQFVIQQPRKTFWAVNVNRFAVHVKYEVFLPVKRPVSHVSHPAPPRQSPRQRSYTPHADPSHPSV